MQPKDRWDTKAQILSTNATPVQAWAQINFEKYIQEQERLLYSKYKKTNYNTSNISQ